MSERLRTLVLEANGGGWSYVAADTVLRGLLRSRIDTASLPPRLRSGKWARRLLGLRYEHLSYMLDWREALCAAPELQVEICNINNLVEYRRRREQIRHYPLVIVLHSAAGDSMALLARTAHWFEGRQGRMAVFLGNEYDLMEEKLTFLRAAGAEFVCSQLPLETARWVYAECRPTRVLALPHALNPHLYRPAADARRELDIGFCGDVYSYAVGDTERTDLIRLFQRRCAELGLAHEFRLNARMPREEWASFLRRCRGSVGAESGSYYLDRRGEIIRRAKAYVRRHPGASFEEVFRKCFQAPGLPYVSGKAISSRHFEPIGTKTCQLLLEGNYNGILQPGEHYIPLKKDLSDVEEGVRTFQDGGVRARIVERAYEYVMDQHTYRHRVRSLIEAVAAGPGAPEPGGRPGARHTGGGSRKGGGDAPGAP